MKKIIYTFFIGLLIILPALAEDIDTYGGIGDTMKYTNSVENAFSGQKMITDEEFQKTLEQVKAKKNKKDKKNKPLKGKSFNEGINEEHLNETAEKNLLLGVGIELLSNEGNEIPMGHYKIVGEKNNNKVYLDFYQSSTLIAKIPAKETNDDFGEKEINFVKLLPHDSENVKLIYGSIDFNAYTFIKIKNTISDFN